MDFLEFLNVMHGRYEHATFQEKRNAIEVLGVRVVVRPPTETYESTGEGLALVEGQEWFSAKEAARLLGIHSKTIHRYRQDGIITNYKEEPFLMVHRDELIRLQKRGFIQRNTEEVVRERVEISYSPRFNVIDDMGNSLIAVPVSLHTLRYINVSAC